MKYRLFLGSKRQRQSSRHEPTAVRRSVRESRKVFDSLNEHTLVRSLVGDYLDGRQSGRDSKRRQLLDDGETDSQEEVKVLNEDFLDWRFPFKFPAKCLRGFPWGEVSPPRFLKYFSMPYKWFREFSKSNFNLRFICWNHGNLASVWGWGCLSLI